MNKSRCDKYLEYLLNEEDNIKSLPVPTSRMDFYLYELCKQKNNTGAIDIKAIKELSVDKMNNGLGIRYTDNSYERLRLTDIPDIANTVKQVSKSNNVLSFIKTNRNVDKVYLNELRDIKLISANQLEVVLNDNKYIITFNSDILKSIEKM